MACFEIKDLSFSYPKAQGAASAGSSGKAHSAAAGAFDAAEHADAPEALQHIELTIADGEYVLLCGKSGCGKTTLLRHCKTVLAPHGNRSGQILFHGRALEETDQRTQSAKIGYVMQDPDTQIVTDKVWHELAFGLESLGMDQKTMRLRVAEMASYFGIQDWFYKDVGELSGGQKQLLNLASIMAMQPDVLILDEPTSQLDPIAAADFLNTVRKINLELGTTILITEHRLEDIYHAADRVIVMDEGRIIADASARQTCDFLQSREHEMFTAMPAPVQIYYGLGGAKLSGGGADAQRTYTNFQGSCPLTVREGRSFLSELFTGRDAASLSEDLKNSERHKSSEELSNAPLIVSLKDVWFRYEKDAPDVLRGVNLDIPAGALFTVVGGNGTGKSTMLKSICGICKPYRGKIQIKGKKLQQYKGRELFAGLLAMLPQDPRSIFVKKTVRDELLEMCDCSPAAETAAGNRSKAGSMVENKTGAAGSIGTGNSAEERICRMAELCEIEGVMDRHPYDLSGGEQQRAALAKVMLTEPGILLLDEPTKGMDSFFKQKFARVLKKLLAEGVTIVMVSHDIEFCARYADLVGMFFDGGIVTVNTPEKFFARNSFYTTAANRMSRHIFENAVNVEDVIELCRKNL